METLLTPAEVARRLRCRKERILAWIHGGQLPAMNLAGPSGKPRYKVRPQDLAAFERGQLIKPPLMLPPSVTDFYPQAT